MSRIKTILCLCLTLFVFPSAQAEQKNITLKDGSMIVGELISFQGGVYTVQTANLGRLQLQEADVVAMVNQGAHVGNRHRDDDDGDNDHQDRGNHGNYTNQVNAIQNQIASNPQLMNSIVALAEDPEIAAIVSDPALLSKLNGVLSGQNMDAAAQDPAIQRLMANPKIQAIIQQMGAAPASGQ